MLKEKQPNHQLARLITEAGFSNKGLADRIVRLGRLRGAPDLRYNHSSIARWLRGEQPRHPVPEIIAEVFTIELGRRVSVPELGMKPHTLSRGVGLELPTNQAGIARTASILWKADLDQQRLLVDAEVDSSAFATTALRWLIGPWDPAPAPTSGRRIGASEVEEIRQVTHAFRILDNRLGGGHVRGPVIEYLHTHVGPLLRDGRSTEEIRRRLFAAAADLTKLAAWLYHDLDKQGLAQRYFIQALAMAKFAGDDGLSGEVLAAMSQQAHYVAQPAHAVDLARAAQTAAHRAGLPLLMTECLVMEAHGYAAQREPRACALALTRANRAYERATSPDLPDWLTYFDEAYFAAKIAHCFRDLGRASETEQYALRSLNMDPAYRRGKTFNIAVLAMALAKQGRIDEACEQGRTAIDMAAGLTSARVYRYIRDLARAFHPYESERDVRELMDYAEERLPALRVRGERP
ncbi:hypothetical protein [Actinomadura livida]|uniref:Sporulation protein n=1 Tax=Actinomadura livida TaxID=79909 RepID=A0A7W7I7F9_9ACTN|nr:MULTISPECIES: hypothetical protein [Actinomadura]MBB4771910.1 hypothetical protein [Actinomadura catellatispora]GGU03326.1 hypothetical protein GCM10010208_29330 [Actinomadura livida]